MNLNFENTFQKLPAFLFERVKPTPLKNAKLIHATALQIELGLNDDELKLWLNGEIEITGEQRIATRYAGHQFGVWAGQLGDGRAISLGELTLNSGERLEIQTKGSGLTPFSRMGDGKAVVRSSVREYLCSIAMGGLGIPTSCVLAMLVGDDEVYREEVEKSAIVARTFPTNLRFGHFEMCYHFNKKDELNHLIVYTQESFFKSASTEEMLQEIVARTAKLMALWQGVGFCHGVMNTDNMSVLGLTIDYGPFGFLEDTKLDHICNHSDHQGRYAYNQQPSIAQWNLERLLVCFMDWVPRERLIEILNSFSSIFEKEYLEIARKKMGLYKSEAADFSLFIELLKTLDLLAIDYTFFFRVLSSGDLTPIWDYYGKRAQLLEWYKGYLRRLEREEITADERIRFMKKNNPKYVLKNYIAQEIIEDVKQGENIKLTKWINILENPFDEHPEFERYAQATPPEFKNHEVSCSS